MNKFSDEVTVLDFKIKRITIFRKNLKLQCQAMQNAIDVIFQVLLLWPAVARLQKQNAKLYNPEFPIVFKKPEILECASIITV